MCYRCDVPNWRNRPIRVQRLTRKFGYKTFCRVHIWKDCHLHWCSDWCHQIPIYKEDAPPKIIVEFTRRDTRNRFYHNGSLRKLANKRIQDLPYLNPTSTENLYISESLTPYKKQLFSKVNKQKKKLKWKYIWTQSGIIFIKANENSTTTHSFDTLEDLAKFQNELQHLTA